MGLSQCQATVLRSMKNGKSLVADYTGDKPIWRIGKTKIASATARYLYCRGFISIKSSSCGYVLYELTAQEKTDGE